MENKMESQCYIVCAKWLTVFEKQWEIQLSVQGAIQKNVSMVKFH